jgi:trans-aconitate methyltransferase
MADATNHRGDSAHAPRLSQIRNALVDLHKALVEYDRVRYEKAVGAIASPNQFLDLLMRDPWFAWLHPISQLIVSMDQALDEKEPLTIAIADALVSQAHVLLKPTESGEGFSKHYFDALQDDPDVVFAHAAATKLIRQGKADKS